MELRAQPRTVSGRFEGRRRIPYAKPKLLVRGFNHVKLSLVFRLTQALRLQGRASQTVLLLYIAPMHLRSHIKACNSIGCERCPKVPETLLQCP